MDKFKNRAERNKDVQTMASLLFHKSEILIRRPEGMSKEEFKQIRKLQTKAIRIALKK